MAPPTLDYNKVPDTELYRDAPEGRSGSEESDSDDAADYTGRAKRRSIAESERARYDQETLGGQEEVERLLAPGSDKRKGRRPKRGELGRLEQGGKSESSSVSGEDESPARTSEYTKQVSGVGGLGGDDRGIDLLILEG